MRAICIVLQLGNLVFEPDENDEERADISSKEELQKLADLMGVPEEDIKNSLTLRTVRARNEEYKVPLNTVKAKDSCDAFAKEIYAKAFLWLVRTINDATCAEKNYDGDKDDDFGIIALLDIFGFESFEVNRFEQLCINYANEKLQQKFTQDIFRSVQSEYEYEGIELGEITYDDNVDVLNLVEGRMGLIAVLNEECVRPKGNDTAFVNKIQTMNKDQNCLFVEKSFHDYEFGVKHYAGPVVYDANSFVTKNMDNLPSDLMDCAHKSTNAIVSKELENDTMMNSLKPAPRHPPRKGAKPPLKRAGSSLISATVWTKFKNQLGALMANLGETRSRYIRCIKPNKQKKPRIMQHLSTTEQLRCAGVVAAVTISRSAFPNRLEHEIVMSRFKSLWVKGAHHATAQDGDDDEPRDQMRDDVETLLDNALKCLEVEKADGTVTRAFVIGKTRAYFRAGALEHLESERLKGLSDWAVELQRMGRGFTKRSQYLKMRSSAIMAAAKMRRFVARRKFLRLRYATIVLQCWARCNMAVVELDHLRRDHMATMIQTHWRMKVAEAMLKKNIAAAVLIQANARGAIQRPKYRADLIEKREEAKLENQLKALQRKLEEAEARRIEAEQKAAQPVVVYRDAEETEGEGEEEEETPQKEEVPNVLSSDDEGPSVTVASEAATSSIGPAGLTAQQQTLMDESGKMLEYLRKEVFKLRSQNTQLRTDFDLLKENNQRLMDANASAGASFAALNQHAKQLNKTNAKLMAEVTNYKQQVQKMNIINVEIKEELKDETSDVCG
jgi:myosin-5